MSLFEKRKVGSEFSLPKESVYPINTATAFKRFAAFMLDSILVFILAIGIAWITSAVIKYDNVSGELEKYYEQYGIYELDEEGSPNYCVIITQEEGETDEAYKARLEKDSCYNAYLAFNADEDAIKLMTKSLKYGLLIISVSAMISTCLVYFIAPVIFKNGQTVGMKVVRIGLVTNKAIKVTAGNSFLRWSMGIFIIETMIPIYLAYYGVIFGGNILICVMIILAIIIGSSIAYAASPNRTFLHDLIAGTVVVDMNTQQICNSLEEYEENIRKGNTGGY